MRKHILFMTLAFAGILMMSCSPKQATENSDVTELPESEIMVYYFHNERRCATCEAVEAETKAALEKYYPEELKDGKIAFVSLNLEETTGAEIAGRFQIASQALIIVKGEDLKDITSEGFLYARTAPDKLYDAVKSSVDSML